MDRATSDALRHKVMNLYQIQMASLDQNSQLITQLLPETSTQNKFITQILVENKHLLSRLQQINATRILVAFICCKRDNRCLFSTKICVINLFCVLVSGSSCVINCEF